MFRTILVFSLGLFLSGCFGGGGQAEGPGSLASRGGELTIMDYMGTHLPRTAYFAKFEIVDGVGVSLLYPVREGDRRQLMAGTHHMQGLVPVFVKAEREAYDPRATGLLNQAPGTIRSVGMLVVTSDEPLALDLFLDSPSGLRDFLGQNFSKGNVALERILNAVVQNPDSGYWEYDFRTVTVPRAWMIGG